MNGKYRVTVIVHLDREVILEAEDGDAAAEAAKLHFETEFGPSVLVDVYEWEPVPNRPRLRLI
jgi:hypothetical protein